MSPRSNVPSRIGRYDVLGRLATGGMAEIFLGRQSGPEGFERPVVVKRILPHLAREQMFHDMFLDEARIVARLRHPNIVQVQELGDDAGELYLVMEYLEGESLSTLLRRLAAAGTQLPLRLALQFTADAAAGLHAAHEVRDGDRSLELVHRDVSPHNLFVLYSGQIKVIDFGIAKAAGKSHRTETGTLKGKFAYMAPEQMRAESIDRRVDVFALGVVLYELLTGKRLFEREHDLLVMRAVCEEPITPPSVHRPEIDPEIDRICLRALARDRDERYPTAAHLRRDLVNVLSRMLGDVLPEEEAALLLTQVFGDRIAQKAEMISIVRAGRALTQIVGAETSGDTALPALAQEPSTGTVGAAQLSARRDPNPSTRRLAVAVGAVALGVGAVAVTWSLLPGRASVGTPSAAVGAPAGSAAPGAEASAAELVPNAPTSFTATAALANSASAAAPSATASSATRSTAPQRTVAPKPRTSSTAQAPPKPTSTAGSGFSRFD